MKRRTQTDGDVGVVHAGQLILADAVVKLGEGGSWRISAPPPLI